MHQALDVQAVAEQWDFRILFGLKHHVPIHCGEFGISMIQPAGDGAQWLEDYLAFFERFPVQIAALHIRFFVDTCNLSWSSSDNIRLCPDAISTSIEEEGRPA